MRQRRPRSLGFFNTIVAALQSSGVSSGFFNTAVSGAVGPFPAGVLSGFNSGLFNIGTANSGILSLGQSVMKLG